MFLVGDIGGTKSRLAIFSDGADPREPLAEEVFPSDRYPGIEPLIQTFLERKDLTADRACFAVAGPTGPTSTATGWCAPPKTSLIEYSGLVPMSP